ncbi:hypothetical protein NS14008_29375 [Nocardia seriolae]|nr:hypothetical protein NS14008_29375 [Nocardia seriolae]PSK27976.1 hypothetical protein C6575_28915 [Nocardia seriolae]RLP27589.1 hypothetical protein D6158_28825 [Nocardia seriolae]
MFADQTQMSTMGNHCLPWRVQRVALISSLALEPVPPILLEPEPPEPEGTDEPDGMSDEPELATGAAGAGSRVSGAADAVPAAERAAAVMATAANGYVKRDFIRLLSLQGELWLGPYKN